MALLLRLLHKNKFVLVKVTNVDLWLFYDAKCLDFTSVLN